MLIACQDLKQAETGTPNDSESPESADGGDSGDDDHDETESQGNEPDSSTKRTCPPAADFPSPLVYVLNEETVFDTVTGLEWERTFRESSLVSNFAAAKTSCAALRTGDHADWRPPTRSELFSIVDYDDDVAKISRTIFPDSLSYPGWTSSSAGPSADDKWLVFFSEGAIGPFSDVVDDEAELTITPTIRCVRVVNPPCKAGSKRFVQNGKIVRDEVTGLEWERGSGGAPRPPAAAGGYCSSLSGADPKRPWRVPSAKELESLHVDGVVDPLFSSQWDEWLTSTQSTSYGFDVRYFFLASEGRIVMTQFNIDAPLAVRCVR